MSIIIYQALTRLWGEGRFSSWDRKSLSYIKSLGADYIWYTGIPRHSSSKDFVKGNPGSPYAISDWMDVNPYFAARPSQRMLAFDALVRRTHSSGLKVMIDFIPNHVAKDYQGEIVHYDYCDYDWTDTLKVDWSKEQSFNAMLGVLRFWASKGVDGFRCDMVELVDAPRLAALIKAVKAEYPELLFVAEVYQKEKYLQYLDAGFDLLYDKSGLYDVLVALASGWGSAKEISYNWQRLAGAQDKMLNFLENHDEIRSAAGDFASLGVSLLFNNASFMLYFGQEVGEDAAESSSRKTSIFDWVKPRMIGDLYEYVAGRAELDDKEASCLARYRQMLSFAQLPAFKFGQNWDLCYCNEHSRGFDMDRHFAFVRYDSSSAYLVVCNFSNCDSEIEICIPAELSDICKCNKICVKVEAKDCLVYNF